MVCNFFLLTSCGVSQNHISNLNLNQTSVVLSQNIVKTVQSEVSAILYAEATVIEFDE
ncbi:MAG: hypothetical protein ACI399_07630 [Candidatus Cryptobacteroides sp.]